jgi:prepilin-type N-terminal cleavage/methylation domain-containing protein
LVTCREKHANQLSLPIYRLTNIRSFTIERGFKLKNHLKKITAEQGFTLIELIISLVIFLVSIAAIFGILRISMIQRNTVDIRTDQFRSARIAMEYIRRDALNAGYGYHRTGGNVGDNAASNLLGIASDADTVRDLLTSIIAGNDRNTNTLATAGVLTDSVSFVSRDTAFNNGNLVAFNGVVASGTAVDVTTAPNGNANCQLFDLYLIESLTGTSQVLGVVSAIPDNTKIRFAPGDPLNINQSATGVGEAQSLLVGFTTGGTAKKVNLVSYSVTNDGVLVRRRFGNQTGMGAANQIESRELVYGVSDFQVLYYMENGTTVADPSLNNNGRANQITMNDVVQIQLTITLASPKNDISSKANAPIVLKEYISTKNLRYEAS